MLKTQFSSLCLFTCLQDSYWYWLWWNKL